MPSASLAAVLPHLPPALLDIYIAAWTQTGDHVLALAEVRTDPRYDDFFPGIRDPETGALVTDESTYLGLVADRRLEILSYGINPDLFETQIHDSIRNRQSDAEFAARLESADELFADHVEEVRATAQRFFGIDTMTRQAAFATFLNPALGQEILDRRLSISQIGGEAALRSFSLTIGQARRLHQLGLSRQGSAELFSQAASDLPVLDTLAQRFEGAGFSLDQFIQAGVIGDPTQRRRVRDLLSSEAAQFRGGLGFAQTRSGGLAGLVDR